MKKFLKIALFSLLGIVLITILYAAVVAPPVMTGMAAKTVCSCVYVAGRSPESVVEKELKVFPLLDQASLKVNNTDSTVTARILWQTSKAIFRKGLGCTLLSEKDEAEIRSQQIAIPQPAPYNSDTIAWPTGNANAEGDTTLRFNSEAVNAAIENAFRDVDQENPVNTLAVVAVYKGKIIGEKYADGFNQNSVLMGWSMTKSITNALVGILVHEGKLKTEEAAPVPEWQNDDRKKITLNNLLQASSGLDWSESYFNPASQFHTMFILSDDKAGYAAQQPLVHEPGTFFQYSSGTTNILSRMVRQTVGDEYYYRFPYKKLFYKIGMTRAIIEPDASGTFVASSYGFASARDWARLGLLYLNDGVWNGERILPEGWVKYSFTPAPAATRKEYGAQIWLNEADNEAEQEYPGLPREAKVFDGFEKNYVVIIPSKDLVVVRLGVTHNRNFSLANLVNGIAAAVE